MEAFHDAVKAGKARYIGVSSIWRAAGLWLSSLAVAESACSRAGDRRHKESMVHLLSLPAFRTLCGMSILTQRVLS